MSSRKQTDTPARACRVCGAALPRGRSAYCSEACAKQARNIRARELTSDRPRAPVYKERICAGCGRRYTGHIKSKRCAACQAKANAESNSRSVARQKAGEARKVGETDRCALCGNAYIIRSPVQKYCPDCAPGAYRKNDRAASLAYYREHVSGNPQAMTARNAGRRISTTRVCPVCQQAFHASGNKKYCSEQCRAVAHKQQVRSFEARRGKRRK